MTPLTHEEQHPEYVRGCQACFEEAVHGGISTIPGIGQVGVGLRQYEENEAPRLAEPVGQWRAWAVMFEDQPVYDVAYYSEHGLLFSPDAIDHVEALVARLEKELMAVEDEGIPAARARWNRARELMF